MRPRQEALRLRHRLALQGPNGNPEYSPIETPALEFYAGFSHAHIQLRR